MSPRIALALVGALFALAGGLDHPAAETTARIVAERTAVVVALHPRPG
jgi:hypothetical protein